MLNLLFLGYFVNEKVLNKASFLFFILYLCSCTSVEETQQGKYFTYVINQ